MDEFPLTLNSILEAVTSKPKVEKKSNGFKYRAKLRTHNGNKDSTYTLCPDCQTAKALKLVLPLFTHHRNRFTGDIVLIPEGSSYWECKYCHMNKEV
jgi:hypothetical protein